MEERVKSIWTILLTVLIAGAVVGGGTYYYLNNKATKDKDALNSQITALETEKANLEKQLADLNDETTASEDSETATSASSTATNSNSITANWQNYENTKYGYSLKYPSGWFVYGYSAGDETTTASLSIALNNAQDRSHVVLVSTGNNADMEATLAQDSTKINFQKTDITFLGINATEYTWTTALDGQNLNDSKTIKLVKGGKTYYLSGITRDYEKIGGKDSGIFNEILSTFLFAN